MAPLTKATAAIALAVCSATVAYGEPTAQKTPDTIAVTLNLARRGKLDVLVEKVAFDGAIADAVAADVPALAGGAGCPNIETVTPVAAKGLVSVLQMGDPDWVEVIQGVLDAGVGALSAYPTEPWSAKAPWDDAKKANLAYLLWSTSSKVGCAYTTDCPTKNLLVCRFTPTAADTKSPFTADYFAAVKARTIALSGMEPSDVDGNSGGGSGSSAFTALPSLLLGCIGAAVSFMFV